MKKNKIDNTEIIPVPNARNLIKSPNFLERLKAINSVFSFPQRV